VAARSASALLFLLAVLASPARSEPPTPKPTPAQELDRIALDVFKEMHNQGAALYNADDTAGCLKVYRTALLSVKPFLKHRPAIQNGIEKGLAEAEKIDGPKAQAFRLHELIVQVRTDLKVESDKPAPPERPPDSPPSTVTGSITLDGQPLAGASVTFAGGKRAFTAITDAGGRYAVTDPIPPGQYAVIVTGAAVPAKFHTTDTSGLVLEVMAGKNNQDLRLQSK